VREYVVSLPLPDRGLNPHAKGNWRSKYAKTKQARNYAKTCAFVATKTQRPKLEKSIVSMVYCVAREPGNDGYRPTDVQNAISAVKAYIDGCKDAGLIVDDSSKHLSWGECVITKEGKPGVFLTFREVE